MIETNRYKKFKNVKENDDQIFFTDINGLRILGIADGVSNCSKGRVASATLCFALSKYFNEHPITNNLTEYVNNAIEDAIVELREVKDLFDEHFDNIIEPTPFPENILPENHIFNDTNTIKQEEAEPFKEIGESMEVPATSSINSIQIIESEKENMNIESGLENRTLIASDSDIELKSGIEIADTNTIIVTNELKNKLYEIFSYLKDFNENEYEDVNVFVKCLLSSVTKTDAGSFNFQTTLSLNILKSEREFVELNSFNYGDSELLIISVNLSPPSIDSQISHYRLHQGDLKSYISSSKGRNGRLDISTRILYENDLLLIGSDGTYFSKTSKASGNPFSPLHHLITKCLSEDKLPELPNLWFEKLKSIDSLDDDFSMFLITCNKKVELEKETNEETQSEPLINQTSNG